MNATPTINYGAEMTEERFAVLTVNVWRKYQAAIASPYFDPRAVQALDAAARFMTDELVEAAAIGMPAPKEGNYEQVV